MSETSPEYQRLPDGTHSVETGVGRTVFADHAGFTKLPTAQVEAERRSAYAYAFADTTPAPALLSAERLAEIRAQLDLPRARNSYVTDYGVAADVVDELLEHVAVLTAERDDTARELSYERQMREQTESAMIALAAQVAGLKQELAEQEKEKFQLIRELSLAVGSSPVAAR